MSPSMRDLRATMEAAGAGIDHPADRLDLIRRRVRRGRRRRLAAGAAAVALGTAGVLTFLPSPEGPAPQLVQPAPTPSLTGRPATGLPASEEGMRLVTAVEYGVLNQAARLTFTPTGPNSLIVFRCDQQSTIYELGVGSVGCGSPRLPTRLRPSRTAAPPTSTPRPECRSR